MTRRLTVALTDSTFTRPLLDGRARIAGVDPTMLAYHPSELFWRQLHFAEFDVFEASLSTCFRLASLDDRRFVALPVFTTRTLCHLGIVVGERSGIESPADLRGRKIGVPEYQQTSAVWSRGVLQHDFGVDPADVHWVMERGAAHSHGAATDFRPPEGVRVDVMSPEENIGTLLAEDYLAGSLLYLSEKNLVDRSPERSEADLRVRRLFDPETERARYLAGGTGLHATHCVAVRRELAEELPWLVLNLYSAFTEAKAAVLAEAAKSFEPWRLLDPATADATRRLAATDPVPYGMAANRTMLDRLGQYVAEQGIAVRKVSLDEVFAPQTLDL
ncbi:ABC transporter substrate-binding protein [Amycolatopsis sp. CA-161197]|uniref:ABC transporter substrate-binding protein n=1 Tax=Amycolatopsis sp. CA-161197 TaxID=3239922 RepID=UPI003D918289